MTNNYRCYAITAIAFAVVCWLLGTGLAVEKVLHDGVQSYTLLFAMPVLVLAVGWLVHQGVSDLREWRIFRAPISLAIAGLALCVTLPVSIGSSGAAKDTAVAEAQASNRGLQFAEGDLIKAQNDLADAKEGAKAECVGAPEVIEDGRWPKCQWWRRQETAHTLSIEAMQKRVVEAPVAQVGALSGEKRIAWVAAKLGYNITEDDIMTAQPISLPVTLELLCAFALFMGLEFRTLHKKALQEAAKAVEAKAALVAPVEPIALQSVPIPALALNAPETKVETVATVEAKKPRRVRAAKPKKDWKKPTVATLSPDALAVIAALQRMNGKAVNGKKLAKLMGVSQPEASKRLAGVGSLVSREPRGSEILFSLNHGAMH
jgi:hypothetical protein